MPGWEIPLALAALSTAGSFFGGERANKQNREEAQRNRDWQERMSNTSVRRSVNDYREAGLNVGLAYERSASSPGGAMATMSDTISPAIANANRYREINQAMQIAREQHKQNLALTAAQAAKTRVEGKTAEYQGDLLVQQKRYNDAVQPFQKRLEAATALLQEYQLPGAKNTAEFEALLGRARPGIASAKTVAEILKLLTNK